MSSPPRKSEALMPDGPNRSDASMSGDPTRYLPRVEPGRIGGVLRRRGWVLILGIALAVAAMWVYVERAPKYYEAVGSVEISGRSPDLLNIDGLSPEESKDLEQLRTIERNLASSALLLRVARENGLLADGAFAPAGASEQEVVALLAKRTRVELDRGTRVVVLSVEDRDPLRAKVLVESLVGGYDLWIKERRDALSKQAVAGLAGEEAKLRKAMESSALAVQRFREEHPVPGLETVDGAGLDREVLGALEARLIEARAERLRLEAEYEAFKKLDPANPDSLAGVGTSGRAAEVFDHARALQVKELEFVKIQERYRHKHPVYQETEHEISNLKENLSEAIRVSGQAIDKSYRIGIENEAKLSAEVDRARAAAIDVEGLRARFDRLRREADAARDLHDKVNTRLRESVLATAVAGSALAWAEPPFVPEKASSPDKRVLFPLAAFVGLTGGLVLMIGLELGTGKVNDPAAATRATGVPMLTSLPVFEAGCEGDFVLLSSPESSCAEAFRRLCVSLQRPLSKPGLRTVLFAGAAAGEGRSTCAMNYAASLAVQGHRTLLLDADLRRPGLSRDHLGDESSGLGDYLAGESDLSKACFPTVLPNLYLLSSGPIRDDAAELLLGTRLAVLLEDAHRWFDVVVIDSPPVLAVSDALALARYADVTCLVIRRGVNLRTNLRKAAEWLRSAGGNPVGFIWNELPASVSESVSDAPCVPCRRSSLSDRGSQSHEVISSEVRSVAEFESFPSA
ncbi:MAG: polysaccharide biosynthesis tyrosine autokinase [Verrucomicrobia bacterium]|nr:MAG: polysaccharide biosynthesis tyrosine autokinase [Verrucomicrobiota bacterium]TAF41179.1 MAG: polysaccharide biosynthesis tyrosine autokinase [Verrucomicrobiota bacterium]